MSEERQVCSVSLNEILENNFNESAKKLADLHERIEAEEVGSPMQNMLILDATKELGKIENCMDIMSTLGEAIEHDMAESDQETKDTVDNIINMFDRSVPPTKH